MTKLAKKIKLKASFISIAVQVFKEKIYDLSIQTSKRLPFEFVIDFLDLNPNQTLQNHPFIQTIAHNQVYK